MINELLMSRLPLQALYQTNRPNPKSAAFSPEKGAEEGAKSSSPAFQVEISPEARKAAKERIPESAKELNEEEQKEVQELEKRDREVRAHEQAHVSSSGGTARGGPKFEFETGPDNKRYANSGHVNIDTSKVPDNPTATIQKAQTIYRAATAPAKPSGADRQVASVAKQMESEAQKELREEKNGESKIPSEYRSSDTSSVTGAQLDLVA